MQEFSESPGNVFISPASIKTTLALILEGAKGISAEEIENALRVDDINDKEIREILARLLFDLNVRLRHLIFAKSHSPWFQDSTSNTVLEAANSIFVSDKFSVLREYEKKVVRYYKGAIKSLDFSNVNAAVKTINAWVANATHGLIQQVVGNRKWIIFVDACLN